MPKNAVVEEEIVTDEKIIEETKEVEAA